MSIFIVVAKQGNGNSYGISHSCGYTDFELAKQIAEQHSKSVPYREYYVAELKIGVVTEIYHNTIERSV